MRIYSDQRAGGGAAFLCPGLTASSASPLHLAIAPPRLRRPWGGVKALRRVWDHESDPWLSPLSTKPSQGVRDVQGGGRCEEWVGNHVLCEPTGSSVSTPSFTPGFTPGSLPVLLPIPDPIQSQSITVLGAENAGSTEG